MDLLQALLLIALLSAALLYGVSASRLSGQLRIPADDATAIVHADGLTPTTARLEVADD